MAEVAFRTCKTHNTDQPADSVEWCPHPGREDLFVCGTYQLREGESSPYDKRRGTILLFRFHEDNGTSNDDPLLEELHRVERSAVLDQKWNPVHTDRLGVAGSDGLVAVYKLAAPDVDGSEWTLEPELTERLSAEEEGHTLALSLDWNGDGTRLLATDSSGSVNLFDYDDRSLERIHRWKAHDFEAWTAAFSRHNSNIIYTGGDDSMLCAYDVRCSDEPVLSQRNKKHEAGVTSLLSYGQREHILLTGCYDGKVRLFDERRIGASLGDVSLTGGVWRMRSNPRDPKRILCACMYENFSLIELRDELEVAKIGEYGLHENICYGCDWQHATATGTTKTYVATCSFYDKMLCVSEVVRV
ncbi:diphthine methyltransferase [Anopheles aquasalis]|uniref:diphthine methyltransferase n=1 Tax=Anopheles aquasalis TaxID=42839 RepID=UPI00215A815D|nr:diphthine methyltransferase [Anopheles aquasalis]